MKSRLAIVVVPLALAAGIGAPTVHAGVAVAETKYSCLEIGGAIKVTSSSNYTYKRDAGKFVANDSGRIQFKSGPLDVYKGSYVDDPMFPGIILRKKSSGKYVDQCVGPAPGASEF